MVRRVAGAVLAAVLAGCATLEPELEAADFSELTGWERDRVEEAWPALIRSCRKPGVEWRDLCEAARETPPQEARRFFEAWFRPWRAVGSGRFTGYYEASLHGSRTRSERYRVPLYRLPPEPGLSRAEIDAGALAGKGLELLWVDDEVDAFFLHIQGSGQVVMDDGRVVRVGYAGKNGHPYVAIGRELVAMGALDQKKVSMQSIRAWLVSHPEWAREVMARNPSYVYFREIDGEGPIGAQGVPLTPGRSLAVDRRYVPLGAPVWLETQDPLPPNNALNLLLIAQDTGGAIKGPIRGDVFWGHGQEAALRAGQMNHPGRWYILLPRPLTP